MSKIRITSTYVENTHSNRKADQISRDHLHIRGEYQTYYPDNGDAPGSPPHTWRIPFATAFLNDDLRITSTYVENTNGYPLKIERS